MMFWTVFGLTFFCIIIGYAAGQRDARQECRPVVINNYPSTNANQE